MAELQVIKYLVDSNVRKNKSIKCCVVVISNVKPLMSPIVFNVLKNECFVNLLDNASQREGSSHRSNYRVLPTCIKACTGLFDTSTVEE